MTPKVAVVQGLRPAPFGTLGSFSPERSGAAVGGAGIHEVNSTVDFQEWRIACVENQIYSLEDRADLGAKKAMGI